MLKAIYKTGSSLLLDKPNDVDLIYFFETKEEKNEALIKHKHNDEVDVHFDYIHPWKVFLGCYIYHFRELIEGEDLHFEDFSIFDHKEEYIDLLKWYAEWLPLENKRWYHILTAVYMYVNNSYDLTASQLEDIQETHDNGITKDKYDYCLKQLNELSLR